jgi:hypothetical protein
MEVEYISVGAVIGLLLCTVRSSAPISPIPVDTERFRLIEPSVLLGGVVQPELSLKSCSDGGTDAVNAMPLSSMAC